MDLSNMNGKRFTLAWIASMLLLTVTDFLVHGVVLMSAYEAHWDFGRSPEEMPFLPCIMKLVLWSLLTVWIYTFGIHPGRPGWLQGATYGFLMGLFFWVPYALANYSVLPIPTFFIGAWIGLGTIQMTLIGLVIGLIYRTKAQTLLKGDL